MQRQYGVGALAAAALWCQLGFSASRQAVQHSGLDVTVYSSGGKPAAGRLSGSDRRCCVGRCMRPASAPPREFPPDYAYYQQVRERRGGNRAALSVGRKIARRSSDAIYGPRTYIRLGVRALTHHRPDTA